MSLRTIVKALFLPILLAPMLYPALAPRISFERLVSSSQFIVHGRVLRSWCGWDAKHKYIWTHHEIEVTESIRGWVDSRLTISEPGGELDGVGQTFGGALPYAAGESVVLFFDRTPIGFLRAVGGGQGKFTVGQDGKARANLSGMDLIEQPEALTGTPLESIDSLDVGELKRRVRAASSNYPYRSLKPR